jgi:hypothetical protein
MGLFFQLPPFACHLLCSQIIVYEVFAFHFQEWKNGMEKWVRLAKTTCAASSRTLYGHFRWHIPLVFPRQFFRRRNEAQSGAIGLDWAGLGRMENRPSQLSR